MHELLLEPLPPFTDEEAAWRGYLPYLRVEVAREPRQLDSGIGPPLTAPPAVVVQL